MKKKTRFFRKLRKGRRGQAMTTYAVITAAMLVAGSVFAMRILPDMLDAYNHFAASLYFGINMPFP
ncbi:MAG TPA: hypothetical protein VM425_03520 [Myxococcota bacterium]|nr:hypothetical protein [Myxococcota bacterium]